MKYSCGEHISIQGMDIDTDFYCDIGDCSGNCQECTTCQVVLSMADYMKLVSVVKGSV